MARFIEMKLSAEGTAIDLRGAHLDQLLQFWIEPGGGDSLCHRCQCGVGCSGVVLEFETELEGITIGPPFGPTESFITEWARPMDVDLLVEMAASRSYIITATPRRRREILDGIRELVAQEPTLAPEFDFPYRTYCFKAQLS